MIKVILDFNKVLYLLWVVCHEKENTFDCMKMFYMCTFSQIFFKIENAEIFRISFVSLLKYIFSFV